MFGFNKTYRVSPFLLVVCVNLTACPVYAADDVRTYRDREFGFSFVYPAAWSEQTGIGRNTRVAITAPTSQPQANCNIVVRRVPGTATQNQDQLNRGLDGKEFEHDYWLRDMPKNTRVFDARRVSLGRHVARSAVLDFSATVQGYTGYTTQLHLVTLSPGLFFGFTCGSQGDTPEEARASYTFWKSTFSNIVLSLRLCGAK